MGKVSVTTHIELVDSDGTRTKKSYRYNNNTLNELSVQEITVSASTTTIIWDPSTWTNYTVGDFDFLMIVPTVDLDVELTCNEGDANEELFSLPLAKGLPLTLPRDDSYYNHSASDVWGGTLDVIDKIRVKESNGTAGKIHLILFT